MLSALEHNHVNKYKFLKQIQKMWNHQKKFCYVEEI